MPIQWNSSSEVIWRKEKRHEERTGYQGIESEHPGNGDSAWAESDGTPRGGARDYGEEWVGQEHVGEGHGRAS